MEFVTVARFSSSFDMHVIKGRLEADGIKCFVMDEHTISANPMGDIALGGMKLKVQEKDVEAAMELLKDTGYNDSGSVSGFNLFTSIKKETSIWRIILLIIMALLLILSAGGGF